MSNESFRPRYIQLFWPLAATLGMAVLTGLVFSGIQLFNYKHPPDGMPIEVSVSLALLLLSVAWLTCKVIDVFLWQAVVQRRTGAAPPRLLVDLVRLLVVLAFVSIIVLINWGGEPVRAMLLSSGAVGIVVGFALQRMISDFFSGIALNIERPFRIGEWIEVDGVAGKVTEINWRATHLVTLENIDVILPNSEVAGKRVSNFDRPNAPFRTEVPVTLEYAVQHEDAKRVLLAAIKATEGVLEFPSPDVIVRAFGNDGVEYRCRFYLDSYAKANVVPDRVADSISRHLWQAGLSVPFPKRDVYHVQMPPRHVERTTDRHVLLSRVSLFASLSDAQVRELSQHLVAHAAAPGDSVIRQGEAGDSLYVVVDGLLDVYVALEDRAAKRVGRLHPGEFFGENGMLTAEPRSASVTAVTAATVYELHRDTLAAFLKTHPQFAGTLSEALAERRLSTDKALAARDPDQRHDAQRTLAQELLGKIRYCLGLT